MAFKLSSLFKKSDKKEMKEETVKEEPAAKKEAVNAPSEPNVKEEVKKAEPKPAPAKKSAAKPAAKKASKTSATKKTETKTSGKKTVAKKTETKKAETKTSGKKTVAKKTETKKADTKTSAKSSSKTSAKSSSKTATKTADDTIKMPPELKGFEKKLKDYAVHLRIEYNSKNSNYIFTEYMAKVFRDTGHKMVMIRDEDAGLITMLSNEGGDSIKSKIVVICRFSKKGDIDASAVIEAQEMGAKNRADGVWCMTTTGFSEDAVRRSKKKDAKVKLFDGKKLYKEFLSKVE